MSELQGHRVEGINTETLRSDQLQIGDEGVGSWHGWLRRGVWQW